LMTAILQVDHIWIAPELILVIGCFKKHRIAYLRMSLLFTVTLESFPHREGVCMKQMLAWFEKVHCINVTKHAARISKYSLLALAGEIYLLQGSL
jgi:hypothetical protein